MFYADEDLSQYITTYADKSPPPFSRKPNEF